MSAATFHIVEPVPKIFLYPLGEDIFEVCYRDPLLDEPVRIRLPRSNEAKAFQRYRVIKRQIAKGARPRPVGWRPQKRKAVRS